MKYFKSCLIFMFVILVFSSCTTPEGTLDKIKECYNYPNPFSPNERYTTIKTVYINENKTRSVEVNIKIYDVNESLVWDYRGEKDEITKDGEIEIDVIWDGRNNKAEMMGSGVYNVVVTTRGKTSETGLGGGTLRKSFKLAIK